MVWSNWKKAIWRGAAVVALFWSGLAWTQTTPRPASDPAERIMVVHENGKSTRCRVLESWQLADGKVAHLLEAVESGERITIVDELPPSANLANPRAMPKRIFNWGTGRTPPDGSPMPPHMRDLPGMAKDGPAEPFAIPAVGGSGPEVVNRAAPKESAWLPDRLPKKSEPQVVDFHTPMPSGLPTVEVARPADAAAKAAEPGPSKLPVDPMLLSDAPPAGLPQIELPKNVLPANPGAELPKNVLPVQPGAEQPKNVLPTTPGTEQPKNPMPTPPPGTVICDPCQNDCEPQRRGWRLGANVISWLQGRSAPTVVAEPVKTNDLAVQPKLDRVSKSPFSTAMPPASKTDVKLPDTLPLAIPKENPSDAKPGNNDATTLPPVKPDLIKLPAPPEPKVDPLTVPDRLVSHDRLKPKGTALPPMPKDWMPETSRPGWPVGTQSVAAAHNGLVGPLTYVPVPTVTVPQPNSPPMPPPPVLPDAPNLNAYVNAFTPPPAPKAAQAPSWQNSGAFSTPPGQQQQQILAYQQQQMQQQMMAQQMMAQQMMMMQYYRQNPYAMNPTPSTGPMANFSRQYAGPLPPNPTGMMPMPYPPMQAMQPQAQAPVQQVQHQEMPTQPQAAAQQIDQLIKVMRESPYPAQREWAAQSLTSHDWRVQPQIVTALLSVASQDPAASVRAGCVYCLGRMGASVEPVFGTLEMLRNDEDPRVRQEVEQAFVRLGRASR